MQHSRTGQYGSNIGRGSQLWCGSQEAALPLSRDNLIINELMREYLMFNGYRNTLSVLLPGSCNFFAG